MKIEKFSELEKAEITELAETALAEYVMKADKKEFPIKSASFKAGFESGFQAAIEKILLKVRKEIYLRQSY